LPLFDLDFPSSFPLDVGSGTYLDYFVFCLTLTFSSRGVRSLLGTLAVFAQSLDFHRTAQQRERSQARRTFEELVHIGDLNVMYSSASDAKDVMVRLDVAVVARSIVQTRHLARLTHFAKLLENPMDRGRRYVRMLAPNRRTDLVAARMLLRSEQGFYDGKPLRCDGNSLLTAAGDKVAPPLNGVLLVPPSIYQPEFSHEPLLDYQNECLPPNESKDGG
jgi:hypothetical protein